MGLWPGGTTYLVNNGATSSGSSFMNIGKLRLLDNDGNPIVPTGIVESDSELEVVFDETVSLRISTSGEDGSDKGWTCVVAPLVLDGTDLKLKVDIRHLILTGDFVLETVTKGLYKSFGSFCTQCKTMHSM
nr:hypothetical protein [Tanacetum cinerariifolium]